MAFPETGTFGIRGKDAKFKNLYLTGTLETDGAVTFNGSFTFGDVATDTLTLNGKFVAGTSGTPIATSTAGYNFAQVYGSSTATSGDARAVYARLYIAGAAGSGEAVRSFTTVNNVAAATAHGAHCSLSFGTTGSLTGLGAAVRGTVHIPNAMSGGTLASVQAEVYGDGASSSVSGLTEFSFFRVVADGSDPAVKATVDTSGYLFSVQGLTVGSGKLFQANTASAATHALRIKVGETPYYIMLTDTGA
jgi:hypothetical protein